MKDMTQGKIAPILLNFTIPLVLGNLLQLFYNAADSIIVGKFVGANALAAVGTCNPIITMAILFINGLCMGASVLMGNYYGAKNWDKLRREISTTMIAGMIFAVFFSLLSIACAPWIFVLIRTPDTIQPLCVLYMRIIFLGMIFTFIYNFYASSLRAIGDSKTPLLFLMLSSGLNILGDLFFVVNLHWDLMGCAVSTVLCESICCLLCGIYIKKRVKLLCLGKDWLVLDRALLGKTVSYGWATALQQAIIPLGKIVMQSMINTMGTSVIAAIAAVNRVDDFAFTPQQNIGHATTAFMAQNNGAGKTERVRDGFKSGMILEVIYGLLVMVVCYVAATPIMEMFTHDEAVIAEGVTYLKLISIMYLLPALTNGIQGFFRGMGQMKVTLFSSTVNMVCRCLGAAPLILILKLGIISVPFAQLIGWIAMLVVELPILFISWKNYFPDTRNKA